jgi:hypothetical protein
MGGDQVEILLQRLERIETMLADLVRQRTVKTWYTTAEVAQAVGKSGYSVREWARTKRIHARKKPCGRGKGGEWLISHEELVRLLSEGLLPAGRVASENPREPTGDC